MGDQERLKEELKDMLKTGAYIYGCGVVGKRLYDVVVSLCLENQIRGFIVSRLFDGDAHAYRGRRILQLDDVEDVRACIIVAVSDAYQNEVLHFLRKNAFKNIRNGYRHSFLNESHMPDPMPEDVPNEFTIDLDELMAMQFGESGFCAYDILAMKNGVTKNSTVHDESDDITVDGQMQLVRGRGAVADALCSGMKYLKVNQDFSEPASSFNYDWLNANCAACDIEVINRDFELCRKEWIKPLMGIIWPDAYEFSDRILRDIASFKYTGIGKSTDVLFDRKGFELFVRKLYDTDDMDEWKIDMKLERMLRSERFLIKVFDLYLERPGFRIKRFGHTISSSGMLVKDKIRKKYKNYILDYIEDVVMHTTDNYHQADEARRLIIEYLK